jgi:hypothetical protein
VDDFEESIIFYKENVEKFLLQKSLPVFKFFLHMCKFLLSPVVHTAVVAGNA